jgi:hypothetical protein
MTSRTLLGFASILEAATGLALIVVPAFVVRLLLGGDLSAAGVGMARVGGFGLLSLAAACWPSVEARLVQLRAMLIYNLLTAFYVACLLLKHGMTGRLLLPAALLHALLTLLLLRAWFTRYNAEEIKP